MLLGFKKRFAGPILSGMKPFTLRGVDRKPTPKIGETLHMYTGLMTKNCELITKKEKLVSLQSCYVAIEAYLTNDKKYWYLVSITIDDRKLSLYEVQDFVLLDGFTDIPDFAEYWLNSSGVKSKKLQMRKCSGFMNIYHWTDLRL